MEILVETTARAPYYVPSTSKNPPTREVIVKIQPPSNSGICKCTALCACLTGIHLINEKVC